MSISSRTPVTACLTFSVSDLTTIPSVTTVLQAICSLGNFSTSTRHMRQFPAIESFGW
jgi:hypothetical protein